MFDLLKVFIQNIDFVCLFFVLKDGVPSPESWADRKSCAIPDFPPKQGIPTLMLTLYRVEASRAFTIWSKKTWN